MMMVVVVCGDDDLKSVGTPIAHTVEILVGQCMVMYMAVLTTNRSETERSQKYLVMLSSCIT